MERELMDIYSQGSKEDIVSWLLTLLNENNYQPSIFYKGLTEAINSHNLSVVLLLLPTQHKTKTLGDILKHACARDTPIKIIDVLFKYYNVLRINKSHKFMVPVERRLAIYERCLRVAAGNLQLEIIRYILDEEGSDKFDLAYIMMLASSECRTGDICDSTKPATTDNIERIKSVFNFLYPLVPGKGHTYGVSLDHMFRHMCDNSHTDVIYLFLEMCNTIPAAGQNSPPKYTQGCFICSGDDYSSGLCTLCSMIRATNNNRHDIVDKIYKYAKEAIDPKDIEFIITKVIKRREYLSETGQLIV